MTQADWPRFKDQLTVLAEGRNKTLKPEAVDGLWELLNDLDVRLADQALIVSARTDRWFPSADLIRKRAADLRAEADRDRALAHPIVQDGTFFCDNCEDTGWHAHDSVTGRPLMPDELIGRGHDTWRQRVCGCRPRNHVWKAKRAGEQRQRGTQESAS